MVLFVRFLQEPRVNVALSGPPIRKGFKNRGLLTTVASCMRLYRYRAAKNAGSQQSQRYSLHHFLLWVELALHINEVESFVSMPLAGSLEWQLVTEVVP